MNSVTTEAPTTSETKTQSRKERLRSLAALGVGNTLEWYDWTIYTVAAVYIAGALFDNSDPASSLLYTLGIFAVGFLMRPLGGVVFGPLADKFGRKAVLLITMVLMAVGSLMIALTPSFEEWGVWSSVALVLARLIQGFAHGGEATTSYAYVAEIAPPKKRGLWSSGVFFAVGLGSLMATLFMAGLSSWLENSAMDQWGWRIPFIFGGLLAFIALWLRRGMMESEPAPAVVSPEAESYNWGKKEVVQSGVMLFFYEAGATLTYYTWVTSAAVYAIGIQGMNEADAFIASAVAQVVYLAFLPVAGWLSDIWGRKTTTIISLLGVGISIFPLLGMISSEPMTLFVAQTVGLLLVAFITGSKPAAISEQIPTRFRTRTFGIAISLGVAIFGGTASYLNTWLYGDGNGWIFNVYVLLIAIISTIVVLNWKNNTGKSLDLV